MILLRLQNRVLLPTIWLPRGEWKLRFEDDPAAFARVLDQSPRTVIEDLGGFGALIRGARWVSATTRVCRVCRQEKSVLEFYPCAGDRITATRAECKACTLRGNAGKLPEITAASLGSP